MNIQFTDDKGKTKFGTVEDKFLEQSFTYDTNKTMYLVSEYDSRKAYIVNPSNVNLIYASYVHMQQDAIKHNK